VAREQRGLARLRRLPVITRDGVEITLEGNLELPAASPPSSTTSIPSHRRNN
jgi:hypothetical protein